MEENAGRVQEQRVSCTGGQIGSPKEDELPPFNFPIEDKSERIIKVIGVGGGGGNAVQHMWEVGVKNVNFVVVNTDSQVLVPNKVPNKIQLGDGLGAGGDPEVGRKKAEESIRKRFHKKLFSPFARACKNYQLINEGDHIAVCISGGKDSMLMAKLFQEIQKHKKVNFELTFLVMDPGYNKENRALIESNAKALGIPITIFESDIFDAVDTIEKSPCYLCARMRRGYLYSKAKELGCNKIALGHHFDDVIETILMGMLYGAQVQTMMPKLHSTNFEGMELIRPLYLVRESDICAWRDYNELHFLQCACHFTETCTTCHEDGTTSSKRLETKKLIAELKKENPFVEANIFRSMENVNLDTVIGYKQKGKRHNFLDTYEDI